MTDELRLYRVTFEVQVEVEDVTPEKAIEQVKNLYPNASWDGCYFTVRDRGMAVSE